jgi:hypothetical protein
VRNLPSTITSLAETYLRAGDRYLRLIASQSYQLSKLRSYLHFLWSLQKKPLLIYQMGKVGSSTILRSLKAVESISSAYSIYHIHWLNPERLRQEERLYKTAARRNPVKSVSRKRFYQDYVWVGQQLSKRISNNRKHPWKIITMVRDPIARNVSSFFQNLETLLSYDYRENLRFRTMEDVASELQQLFLQNYLDERFLSEIDADPLSWFDQELKPTFGIDVFGIEFPVNQGYAIYDSQQAEVLLLRLEDLDRCAPVAFREFLGIENFKIVRTNTGDRKAYSDLYKAFLTSLTLPRHYVESMYNSKYTRYFYTEHEIQAFLGKWAK